MAKDIRTKAHLQGGEIRTKANFGQTVAITVLPDPYEGDTVITPSDERQTLPTRGKTVATDITVLPAPVESLATSENGTFVPSSGNVGFSEVVVDVEPSLESLSVTENGLYLPDSGTDGFDRVSVDVPAPEPVTEQLSVTENGIYEPESGVDGYSRVTVDVPPTIPDLIPLTATANGQYVPTGHDGYSEVNVNVPIPTFETEEKTVTENGVYLPSAGKDGISKVTVDVPSQAPVLDSLSVTQNGTYTPESGVDGFDEVVVNVPTGGGGGLTLLDTIEVNGVRGVQVDIDATWFDDADYVLLVPDLTFSASDWLYIVADATSGGNDYAPRATSVGISQGVTLGMVSGHVVGAWFKDGTNRPSAYTPQSYLYWYMYYASTTMTGTIKIYGIKIPT